MRICGQPRYTVASDGCKYCKRHASIIDGKSSVCPYITEEGSENKCGERASVVANDGIRYCRLHAGIIDKICLEPDVEADLVSKKWCGGYCKDHARIHGMIEKNMCLEPGCEYITYEPRYLGASVGQTTHTTAKQQHLPWVMLAVEL